MDNEILSPALAYVAPESRKMSDLDMFDQVIKQSGISTAETDDKLAQEKNQQIIDAYKTADTQSAQKPAPAAPASEDSKHIVQASMDGVLASQPNRDARDRATVTRMELQDSFQAQTDIAIGVGSAARDIGKNVYNGIIDVLDGIENLAQEKGVASIDLFNPGQKWSDPVGTDISKNLSRTASVAKGVSQFVAPIVAIAGSGGSNIAAMGASAAYNFLAIDPKGQKLQDTLKDTWMKHIPLVSDILEATSSKPDDTELVGRIKNTAFGFGFDAAALGVVMGASKVYGAIARARTPEAVSKAAMQIEGPAAQVKASVVKPGSKADAAAAAAKPVGEFRMPGLTIDDVSKGVPATTNGVTPGVTDAVAGKAVQGAVNSVDEAAQLALFEEGLAKTGITEPAVTINAEGSPRLNINSQETASILDRWGAHFAEVEGSRLRTPTTDKQRIADALIVKDNPEVLQKLATTIPSGTPLNEVETSVLRFIMDDGIKAFGDVAEKFAGSTDPVDLATVSRAWTNLNSINQTQTGNASTVAAVLRPEQAIASGLGVDTPEAIKAIGRDGRKKLLDAEVESLGGPDAAAKLINNVNVLRRMSKIAAEPDYAFKRQMDEVSARSTYMQVGDAVTKVALNGMLSSPSPAVKSVISNSVMAGFTQVENYLEVGIGLGRLPFQKDATRKTLTEANAEFNGLMQGFLEAHTPAWKQMKGEEVAGPVRQDLKEISSPMNQDAIMERAMFANKETQGVRVNLPVELKDGVIANTLSLGSAPTRLLMGIDTWFNHAQTKSFLAGKASVYESKLLADGVDPQTASDLADKYKNNPSPQLLEQADKYAATTTFASGLEGVYKKFDDFIGELNEKLPIARVILPFFKTKANMVEQVMQRSPFAVFNTEFQRQFAQGGKAQNEALAKVTSGTMTMGFLTYLASQGLINGKDTENPQLARALKDNQTVAPPTSIKVGDKWVSINGIDPLASMINAAHYASKVSGHLSEEEYQQAAVAMGGVAASILSPEELSDALSDVLQIYRGDKEASSRLSEIPTRFTPAGGALRFAAKTIDGKERRTYAMDDLVESIKMKYQNQIPWLSKNLPANRNVWGETLVVPDGMGPDALSILASTDDTGMKLKRALERMDDFYETNKESMDGLVTPVALRTAPQNIKNAFVDAPYKLSNEEYAAYQRLRGGLDPYASKPLNKAGAMKDQFYRVMEKHDMLNRNVEDFTPDEYLQLTGELSMITNIYAEQANAEIMNFTDSSGVSVKEKMKKTAVRVKQAYESGTMGDIPQGGR